MKALQILCVLLVGSIAVAQDVTPTPEPDIPEHMFEFPLAHPIASQIDEAYNCDLEPEATEVPAVDIAAATACELAAAALVRANGRGRGESPSDDEITLFVRLVERNPALAVHLPILSTYYNVAPLVSAPEFSNQPVTAVHLIYTFVGLGPTNDYDVTITDAAGEPVVTGTVKIEGGYYGDVPSDPVDLPDTVDTATVQALGAALTDLVPIERQFTTIPCFDVYPDWSVEMVFEDGTVVTMVTNRSNAITTGGPWQVEIDGLNYLHYASRFSRAALELFDALGLPLGKTAGMVCGGAGDPLFDAYPRSGGDG